MNSLPNENLGNILLQQSLQNRTIPPVPKKPFEWGNKIRVLMFSVSSLSRSRSASLVSGGGVLLQSPKGNFARGPPPATPQKEREGGWREKKI